jgi:hypothetical protein
VIKLFTDAFAKSSIEVNSVIGQRMMLILQQIQVSFFSLILNIDDCNISFNYIFAQYII